MTLRACFYAQFASRSRALALLVAAGCSGADVPPQRYDVVLDSNGVRYEGAIDFPDHLPLACTMHLDSDGSHRCLEYVPLAGTSEGLPLTSVELRESDVVPSVFHLELGGAGGGVCDVTTRGHATACAGATASVTIE